VVDDVKAELSPEQLGNPTVIRERLTQKLEQMLPANLGHAVARATTGTGCRSICLIGPTGVGKTTTIAKLAAAFKLRQKQKVGLITIDTYRIAAVDQLRTYANIIGVPLKVVLTPTEFQLLVALARQPGRIFTRSQLLDSIHGLAFESYERAIDAHVKNLRRKLEDDPARPRYVLTVYGVGYRFAEEPE